MPAANEPAANDTDRRLTHAAKQYLEANGPFTAAMLAGLEELRKANARLRFAPRAERRLASRIRQRLRPQLPRRENGQMDAGTAGLHLQQTWRNDPGWNELWHIPELLIEETGWTNDAVLAREAILRHLGDCATDACPLGAWLSVEGLSAAVKAVDPDFARPDGDYARGTSATGTVANI